MGMGGHRRGRGTLLGALIAAATLLGGAGPAPDSAWHGTVRAPGYAGQVFPPWSGGANDPAAAKGLEFTVPEVNDAPDFHGSLDHPKLTIFVAGNYYFAMAPLVAAFERGHPALAGHIYYETLPPGILLRQMRAGGTITVGNLTWTAKPDVFAAGAKKIKALVTAGTLVGPVVTYASNTLAIMIAAGNPGHVQGLADLGRPGLRIVMPNPAWEGVVRQIEASLAKAGGKALVTAVYKTKVANGETILTHVHHRQTPLFLMQGLAVAGVTWQSEAVFQEQAGHPIAHIAIPASQNTVAVYGAALVRGAAHPRAGRAWIAFLRSPAALRIFERYGFKGVPPSHKAAAR